MLLTSIAALLWEYVRAIPGALERFTFEVLGEGLTVGWIDIDDPEAVLFLGILLLGLWLAIVILRQLVRMIMDFGSIDGGNGPQSLGLS